jgi:hypothetical protein
LNDNFEVRLHLVNNRDASVWNYTSNDPGYSDRRWKSGLYIRDDYHLQLAPDITPGNYQINIEANICKPSCTADTQLTFFNLGGQVLGTQLTLPTLLTVSG